MDGSHLYSSFPVASSSDGNRVLFQAHGNNSGPADEGIDGDLYLRDFTAGTTTLVSANASGTDGGNASADYGWIKRAAPRSSSAAQS